MDDEDLLLDRIRRLARGETEPTWSLDLAQQQLFAQHRGRIVGVCRRIVGDPERAEELANDTMMTAWEKIVGGGFEGRSRLSTFLFGIARNKCYRSVRKRTEDLLEEDQLFALESPEAGALRTLDREERLACVRQAIRDLEPLEQEVVLLRYAEELPYEVIERVLQIDTEAMRSGVRGILVRVKRRLERSLRQSLAARGHGSSYFDLPS